MSMSRKGQKSEFDLQKKKKNAQKYKGMQLVPNERSFRSPYLILEPVEEEWVDRTPKPIDSKKYSKVSESSLNLGRLRRGSTVILKDKLFGSFAVDSALGSKVSLTRSSIVSSLRTQPTPLSIVTHSSSSGINSSIMVRLKDNFAFREPIDRWGPRSQAEAEREEGPGWPGEKGSPEGGRPRASRETHFRIILKETETVSLFEADSRTAPRGTELAAEYEEDLAAHCEVSFVEKKLATTETQTPRPAKSTKGTLKARHQTSERAAEATPFTLRAAGTEEAPHLYSQWGLIGKVDKINPEMYQVNVESDESDDTEDENDLTVFEGEEFATTFALVARVLESNNAKKKQKLFNGSLVSDPMIEHIRFTYELVHLWVLKDRRTRSGSVTSISCNPVNNGLFAVTYGKFFYSDESKGSLQLWNMKNPAFPEGSLRFNCSATWAEFSNKHPHVLVLGFEEGHITIVQASSWKPRVMCTNRGSKETDLLPVRQAIWMTVENDQEVPLTCSENGRVDAYRIDETLKATTLLAIDRRVGPLRGVDAMAGYPTPVVPLPSRPAALSVAQHPSNKLLYLVGSSEGCLYKCSVDTPHLPLETFSAHAGPVYEVQFNPANDKVYLTCGADYCVRVWAWGVCRPLVSLMAAKEPVESAAWCPRNPTLIASVSGDSVYVWDLRRKLPTPVSATRSHLGFRLTRVRFTNNGFNLLAGDVGGNVQVFILSNFPFEPKRKSEAVADAIKRAIEGKEELLQQVKALGHPFD